MDHLILDDFLDFENENENYESDGCFLTDENIFNSFVTKKEEDDISESEIYELPKKNNSPTQTNADSGPLGRMPGKIKQTIFKISKVNKKLGRLIKKFKASIKGKHNKNSQDNIIQKVKASFHEKIYNYVNYEYEKFLEAKSNNNNEQKMITKLIKRISPQESKKIKKEENLLWFSLKLKGLLSSKLSLKYSKFESNYNEKRINQLYEKNEAKNVIEILEKNVKDMYEIYCNNIHIEGFGTLKDDLIALRKKMEQDNEENIEEYLKKYQEVAQNLEQIFQKKKPRLTKKKRY